MVLKILITLFVFVAVLALYARFNTPRVVKISRSKLIQASPETLFRYINNSRLIQEWNPFIDGDATVKLDYSGPAEGIGAQWSWEGDKAGAGRATIIASEPNKRVSLRLDFKKPFNVTNQGEYVLMQNGDSTEVTWTIDETALIPRVLSNFMNLDKIVGSMFEKGLIKLKTLVEAGK